MGVASFPWEPKVDAAAQGAAPSQIAPANASQGGGYSMAVPQAGSSSSLPTPPVPLMSNADSGVKQEPGIKPEPASGAASSIPAHVPAFTGGGQGAARAIQHITNQFGSRAATSINTIRSGLVQQQPGAAAGPGGAASQVPIPNPQAQYQQQQQQRMAAQQQQQQQQRAQQAAPNSLSANQMDGVADADASPVEGVLFRQSSQGEMVELGRLEIDRMIHAQIAANARRMEGGGLMLALKQQQQQQQQRPVASKATKSSRGSGGRAVVGAGQVDGPGDDDLKDEDPDLDAINSDLDDPEDDADSSDEEEEGLGHIMLCMYDKVQRVKNKWYVGGPDTLVFSCFSVAALPETDISCRKCTLKDGVLTVNGKEYVFHKATGEYEW